MKRTKIIATLGPALDDQSVLEQTMLAGADVFRANFSHGTKEEHAARFKLVRDVAKKLSREVAILGDLQGPKIRVARFKNKKVCLEQGQEFTLDVDLDKECGDEKCVGVDYKALIDDVEVDDTLLLDDGRLVFTVLRKQGSEICCRVDVGGELSNNKGINRKGGGLSAKALTDKDKADLKTAVALGADYIAVSFPRDKHDIEEARELLRAENSTIGIIAKIERTEAVENIDEIVQASDAVMVARGDLAVEIGDAEVPAVQKHIIQRARVFDKVAITATQMMESMIENTVPTRAEVSDVANAVLDNTDAVMLSAESAVGKHPPIVVETMARVCLAVERQPETRVSGHRMECRFERVDEAIAMAATYIANHLDITAIISLTESGSTPLWMSRIRTGTPIFALTRNIATERKMALYRDIYPVHFELQPGEEADPSFDAMNHLKKLGHLQTGDSVIVTRGKVLGVHGGTNSLKIYQVP